MASRILVASPPLAAIGGVAVHSRLLLASLPGAVLFDEWWPLAGRAASTPARAAVHALASARWALTLLARRPSSIHLQVTRPGALRDRALCAMAAALRVPVVAHVHSTGFFDPGTSSARTDAALVAITRQAEAVIVLSEALRHDLAARVPGAHVVCVRNPVPPLAETAAPARGGAGVRALCVGELCHRKNQAGLARVVSALAADHPELSLDLVGPWGDLTEPERDELRAAACVRLLGGRTGTELAQAYADADLFVLFSDSEAQPLSVLEAMSAGLPVIATDVGGVAQMTAGAPGVQLVPPGGRQELAAAIRGVLADLPSWRQRGRANRDHVEATCSASAHLDALARLHAQAGSTNGRRARR